MAEHRASISQHPQFLSHERFVELAIIEHVRTGTPMPLAIPTPPIAGICPPPSVNPPWDCDQRGHAHSHCTHCGRVVGERDNLRLHTPDFHLAADAHHVLLRNNEPLRLIVAHCADCADSEHCRQGVHTERGDGFCEAFEEQRSTDTAVMLFPGAKQLGRFVLGLGGLVLTSFLALSHSTAQKNGTLSGSTPVAGTTYNSGFLKFYSGSMANADAAETGGLATITLNAAAFGTPASGATTAGSTSAATIAATGTAATARIVQTGDTGAAVTTTQPRIQGAVATSGSDFNVSSTSFVSGGQVSLTSLIYNHPS